MYSMFQCRKSNHSVGISSHVFLLSYHILLVQLICTSISNAANEEFLAVHVLGDSVVDTGNNNGLKTLVRSNFSPYGKNFDDGKATGRFCDGKIISDLIVEAFGIKEILPSYHELPNLQSKDIQTGLSFASAGSGYDPLTAKLLRVYTQQEQLLFFADYIEKLKSDVGEERTKTIIAKSLYVISSGNNDILITYFASRIRKLQYDFPSYTEFLLKCASLFLTDLHKLGARKIAVFNVAPLGCVPFARTIGGGVRRECAENINKAVQFFNEKLSSLIATLNRQLNDSKVILVDVYQPVLELVQNPNKYGYEEIGKACCSTGTVETGLLCNELSAKITCSNASAYVFWDSIHPTQSAYATLAPPVIRQLVF